MDPKTDLPQGMLDMLILKVVELQPLHGYGIAQRLFQISDKVLQVKQGSLYPALHRLENRGWLTAAWKMSENGREAKFYKLTKAGLKQLDLENQNWQRTMEVVRLVMNEARP
jgi:transcriptional regulator